MASPAPTPRAGPDRTEQIGAFRALVSRLAGPGSTSAPFADEAVLLPDLGHICEPDLDRFVLSSRILQPIWAERVEVMTPVTQGLATHSANPGPVRPAHPVQYRRKR